MAKQALTVKNIEDGYQDDRWLGFGYLGTRACVLDSTDPECPADPDAVAAADALALDEANRKGWTADQLFAWINSKNGRWFGDVALSGGDDAMARRLVR